jgi:hypothetical protein
MRDSEIRWQDKYIEWLKKQEELGEIRVLNVVRSDNGDITCSYVCKMMDQLQKIDFPIDADTGFLYT